MDHLMNVYRRVPVTLERGEGVWLWDTEGNRYLDALTGIAVCGLGHAHPRVTETIQKQAAKLIHTSNVYQIANQSALGDLLCKLSGLDQAFFCNSGAEAVEAALKLIILYGHQQGFEAPKIIVMSDSFHGRTLATIAAGGSKKAQDGFEPLMPAFIRVPYNDINALETTAKQHSDIAAVLVEPVQGESGIRIPASNYLTEVRRICDKHRWLMSIDEVQTGLGRTGTMFAYQANQILPDILTLAKALGNGVPIGACLAKKDVSSLFTPGRHGCTFGGNPLSTAAALTTVNEIQTHKLWENAAKQGAKLLQGLQQKLKNHPHVKEVRGKGLMIGIEIDKPCREMMLVGLKKRLLFTVSNENIVRLLPALIIEDEHVQQMIDILPQVIDEFTLK